MSDDGSPAKRTGPRLVTVADVSVAFGETTVLENVDLELDAGEFLGLVGPNGAGKTTLLRTINGLLAPDSGTVSLVDDRFRRESAAEADTETGGGPDPSDRGIESAEEFDPVSELPARETSRRVGTVPQDTTLSFSFPVREVVAMGRTPHRGRLESESTADREAIEKAMERVAITEFAERPIDALSGGERQRVVLARALAQETPVLVLDEPTASLDINHQVRTLDLVSDLVADGRGAIAAIHDLELAARYCDRLCLLASGSVLASGPPEAVLTESNLEEAFGAKTSVIRHPVTGAIDVTTHLQ